MTTQDQATSGSFGGRLAALDDVSGNSQAGAHIRNAITGPDGRQYVVIDATARDGHGDTLLAALTDLGMIRGASFGAVASGFFPVDNLPLLSSAPNLLEARESLYAPRNGASLEAADDPASLDNQASSASQATVNQAAASQGSVVSQGDRAMGTDAARSTYGVDGTGIKVGILSDSFNYLGGQAGDIASGDLPANTTVLDDGLESDSLDEGRAMAQIVHDVAPNASIVFATAQGGLANFANNIIALADAGAKVIVDDIRYSGDPAYQDGIVAQAISQVVARGVTYVTSAGNDRNRGYEAPFDTSGGSTVVNGRTETFHQFAPGQDYIPVTIARAGDRLDFALHWDNPYASVSPGRGATADLDVFIYSDDGQLLGSVTVDEIGLDPSNDFFIRSGTDANTTYRIKIGLHSGEAPKHFKLVTFGGARADSLGTFASNTNDGTVFGHGAAKDAISVGAAYYADTPAYGASSSKLENFSSLGPTLITYDADGNRLAVPELRRGPTLTGPNGGDTTFFFSGTDRNGNGVPDFSGTSASAPHVAALAALMLQANPDLTPEDIRNLLQNSALDMDDPYTSGFDEGFDDASGSGFVQGTAVGFAKTGIITNAAHNPVLRGTHLADTFIGGAGAQAISGGAGSDTAAFSGARGDYKATSLSGGGFTIADLRNGTPDGTDTLDGIEAFRFSDGTYTAAQLKNAPFLAGAKAVLPAGMEDTAYRIDATALLQGYTDPNGDRLSVTGLAADRGSVSLENGTYVITPEAGYDGLVTLTYDVSDGAFTAAATQSFTLVPENDAPVAADNVAAVLQREAVSGNLITDPPADDDPDSGDTLSVTQVAFAGTGIAVGTGISVAGAHGTLTVEADGRYSYAADVETGITVGDRVTDSFTYTLDDGQGGSDTAVLTVTVTGSDTGTADADVFLLTGSGAQAKGLGGNDTYIVDRTSDQVVEESDGGVDLVGSLASYTLSDNVENLTLIGTADSNGTGNALANTIRSNSGDNVLAGGLGNDLLIGGGGKDIFLFDTAPGPRNVDHVRGFSVRDDTIALDNRVFKGLANGPLGEGQFKDITDGAALDAGDRVLYDRESGRLWIDADGSGSGVRVQFAILDNHPTLTFQDFFVV